MPVLHWSPRSPFVRKVMVALHEKGLVDQGTTVRTHVDPMIPLDSFMGVSPSPHLPTNSNEKFRPAPSGGTGNGADRLI